MGANGSVVECLTRDQRVTCLSLTGSMWSMKRKNRLNRGAYLLRLGDTYQNG